MALIDKVIIGEKILLGTENGSSCFFMLWLRNFDYHYATDHGLNNIFCKEESP